LPPKVQPRSALVKGADGYLDDYGLSCSLTTKQTATGTVAVMRLGNDSHEPVSFLRRRTAWDKQVQVFNVARGTSYARYTGVTAYRMPVSDADFETIPAGKTVSADYDLTANHRAAELGEYQIALKGALLSVRVGARTLLLQHECGTARTTLGGQGQVGTKREPLLYDSTCSDAQRADVEYTKRVVRSLLDTHTQHVVADSSLYLMWFGPYSVDRADEVAETMGVIASTWDNYEIACNTNGLPGGSTCEDGTIAWVSSFEDGDRINLCEPWFGATDPIQYEEWSNKAGVLLHEATHLSLAAATDDESDPVCTDNGDTDCYGPVDARALAVANPDKAVDNAENYEHFGSHLLVMNILTTVWE